MSYGQNLSRSMSNNRKARVARAQQTWSGRGKIKGKVRQGENRWDFTTALSGEWAAGAWRGREGTGELWSWSKHAVLAGRSSQVECSIKLCHIIWSTYLSQCLYWWRCFPSVLINMYSLWWWVNFKLKLSFVKFSLWFYATYSMLFFFFLND